MSVKFKLIIFLFWLFFLGYYLADPLLPVTLPVHFFYCSLNYVNSLINFQWQMRYSKAVKQLEMFCTNPGLSDIKFLISEFTLSRKIRQDLQKHTTNLHFLSSSVSLMDPRVMSPPMFSSLVRRRRRTKFNTKCNIFYSIPGGHFMHPSTPLVDELENVPRGHGNNVATSQLLSCILLNPVAKRAEVRSVFTWG